MTGESEKESIQVEQTRNTPLIYRNLRLRVDDKYEKVLNFSLFSPRDMQEIRREIFAIDPIFQGNAEIENPNTGQTAKYFIFGAPDFFFLTGE